MSSETYITLGEKGSERSREIQLLVNIVAPDPRYQPWYLDDEATIFHVREQDEDVIRSRMEGYFGKSFRANLNQPLWCLIDDLKKQYPDWPNRWE